MAKKENEQITPVEEVAEATTQEVAATEENTPIAAEEVSEPPAEETPTEESGNPEITEGFVEESGEVVSTEIPPEEVKKQIEEPPKRKRGRKPKTEIVTVNETLSVMTEEQKNKSDLIDLVESKRVGKILTGVVQSVEMINKQSVAILYHGDIKVIIPALALFEKPEDYRGRPVEEIHQYLISKRLGAEIDYIVTGVDIENEVAVASRLDAMAIRRKNYYFATDSTGKYKLCDGMIAEARVMAVIRAGIFVELCGVETFIRLPELSYQRIDHAGKLFQSGDSVLVKVLEIDRTDRENIKVKASVKQAKTNPYERAYLKYPVGSRHIGVVSMIDENGIFVALGNNGSDGVDCLCNFPLRGRPVKGARVTVKIIQFVEGKNKLFGIITDFGKLPF